MKGKRDFYEGVHGIPWGSNETEAIRRFGSEFGCKLEEISDVSMMGIPLRPGAEQRQVTMGGGEIYGIPLEVWFLSFGRRRNTEPYQLFSVMIKGFEDPYGSLERAKRQMVHRFGPHDQAEHEFAIWYYREMQKVLALHNCGLTRNSHLTITILFEQLEMAREFGKFVDIE